jgi:Cytochrome c oxidase subunit IIa family
MSTPGNSDQPTRGSASSDEDRRIEEEFGHPRGTLAIVIVFGTLFLLGWLGMYFYMFLQRGAPHP